jgi:oligosaccharide repeat unit polymerase
VKILYQKFSAKKCMPANFENKDDMVSTTEIGTYKFHQYKRIDFPAIIYFLGIIFVAGTCWYTFRYISDVVIRFNGEGEYSLSRIFANYYVYSTNPEYEVITPRVLSISQRVLELIGVFCFFSFCYNICLCKPNWKDILYFSGVIGWVLQAIFLSNRGLFLSMLAILIFFLYYFIKMRFAWSKKVDAVFLIAGICALVCFLLFFLKLRVILGRGSEMSKEDSIRYITIYINGGIRDFDIYLRNSTFPALPGLELFYGIYKSLHVFFNVGGNLVRHLETVSLNDVIYSNIFTAFRRFYTVGREWGILLFSGLQGAIYTWGYTFNKEHLLKGQVCFNVILFTYLSYTFLYLPVDDVFYTTCFSLGVPARLILFYCIYFIFFRKKVNQLVESKPVGDN